MISALLTVPRAGTVSAPEASPSATRAEAIYRSSYAKWQALVHAIATMWEPYDQADLWRNITNCMTKTINDHSTGFTLLLYAETLKKK